MLHLAIECSALAGSVAILRQDTVLAERSLPPAIGSVQTLAPTIVELLSLYGSNQLPAVELISVTHGPGSFTGLRGGLALAKMLGLAWGIPIVAVDTLRVVAAQAVLEITNQGLVASGSAADVVAVLNAFRRQVFAAAWRMPASSAAEPGIDLVLLAQPQVLAAELWQAQPLAALEPACSSSARGLVDASHVSPPLYISGAGLRSYTPQLRSDANLIDASHWDPLAACVGRLGWHSYLAGGAVSAAQLAPNYVRSSAAEEVRTAQHTQPLAP